MLRHPHWLALTLSLGVMLAGPLGAQSEGASLNELALDWARGRFASPIVCTVDGQPTRALRRVLIAPGPLRIQPPSGRIVFVDLDPGGATRCFDDLGGDQPNILGNLLIRLNATTRRDLAQRDFDSALRRRRGFEFEILEGRLRIQPVGSGAGEREIDFDGGRARLELVGRGSDDARLLSDLPGQHRVALEIEAEDGARLRFPLALTAPR